MASVTFDGVSKRYGDVTAVDGLDLTIDDHMQEIGGVALAHQFHMGRETLQERGLQHHFDMLGGDAAEDRQAPHLLKIVTAHDAPPCAHSYVSRPAATLICIKSGIDDSARRDAHFRQHS